MKRKQPTTMTPDEIRYAVAAVVSNIRGIAYRIDRATLRGWSRDAKRNSNRALKLLTAAGLDGYGYPLGAELTREQRAVRLIDQTRGLPFRERDDTTVDGFEALAAYGLRLGQDPAQHKRAGLIVREALLGNLSALRDIAADPWTGWEQDIADGWKAMRVAPYIAGQLDMAGVLPETLAPMVAVLRALPSVERKREIAEDIARALLCAVGAEW